MKKSGLTNCAALFWTSQFAGLSISRVECRAAGTGDSCLNAENTGHWSCSRSYCWSTAICNCSTLNVAHFGHRKVYSHKVHLLLKVYSHIQVSFTEMLGITAYSLIPVEFSMGNSHLDRGSPLWYVTKRRRSVTRRVFTQNSLQYLGE